MSSYEHYPQSVPAQPAKRALTRSRDHKLIAGVCAGFADYTGLDVTLVRLVLVAATVLGAGSPILVYVVGWALMPERPYDYPTADASLRDSSTESARP